MARILVVDDESALLKLLETYLARRGHEVTCCDRAQKGLDVLDADTGGFDLAVLDHWLPDMSGMDLLHGVLERKPQLPVLVSSGSFMDIDQMPIPPGHRVAFLQKPYLPKMLGTAVENLLKNEA
ncbi:MAG: response regulator [Acidobacteria bacterium]|nr:response regulator [Acidobacteriota bacterium]